MQGKILSKRYLLAEEIGNGGMGSVFRATDLRTGGQVAVKLPHPFLARDPEYIERLRREAQIAASIYSPRVVRVMDLDADEDGSLFLVMEYVPGETLLDELRRRGTLPVTEVLTLGLETARALDAAAQKGIVHRDLKPHNIKLVEGEVKVLDFGIAKVEGLPGMTSASVFMGTPEYSAPERAEGLGDIRSDIYSVGVILYECLAGHLPFSGMNPMAVLRKHESEPPPPLPADIPQDAVAIVLRCLAKRPDERYQTPRDLIQDLGAALRGLPLPTPPANEAQPRGLARPVLPTDPGMSPPIGSTVVDQRFTPAGVERPAVPVRAAESGAVAAQERGAASPALAPTVVGTFPTGSNNAYAAQPPAPERTGARAVSPASTAAPPAPTGDEGAGAGRTPSTRAAAPVATPAPPPPAPVRRAAPHAAARFPRPIWLIAAAVGALLSAGIVVAVVVLGGGSGSSPTNAAQRGTAVPDAATPAAAAASAVGTAAATAAASPAPAGPSARPPVVAEIPLDKGTTSEERNVIRTLNEANRTEVLAYRKVDTTGLDAYFTGQALTDTASNITGLKRQGRYGIADLTRVEMLDLKLQSPTAATLITRETQTYDEYNSGTDTPVADEKRHFTGTFKWTYHLIKQDSRWLIDTKDFE